MTVEDIIAQVKPLAAKYYRLTGKPLGVTGEVGEYEVARLLSLQLETARTPGYDATDQQGKKYQIKTRSLNAAAGEQRPKEPAQAATDLTDAALLALMDENLKMIEIWEAERADVDHALNRPGSISRNERRMLSLSKFKEIGRLRYRSNGILDANGGERPVSRRRNRAGSEDGVLGPVRPAC